MRTSTPSTSIRTSAWAGIVVALLLTAAAGAAPLAQRHPYQKTLRDYLATLTEADFAVELKPVTYVADYFKDVDTVARYWMFFLTPPYEIPSHQGICLPAKYFTLAAIESGGAVNVGGGFMSAKDVAWWTQWEYPGNPYFRSKPAKLRALRRETRPPDLCWGGGGGPRRGLVGGGVVRRRV